MALTVGELTGLITLDASGVRDGLTRAESDLRNAGRQMGSDAERAGRQAGDDLGEGLTDGFRNSTGGLSDAARAAGNNAGGALGDSLTHSGESGADTAVGRMRDRLGRLQTAAAGIGVAAGAVLMDAFGQALEQGQITGKLGAQLGATAEEAKRYGQAAGQLFKDAVVADFQEGADTIRAIASAGLLPPEATNAQIDSIATMAADLANTFDVDVLQAAKAAGSMVKNGLAKNAAEAFDLLTTGMSGLGPASEDLLDTFDEYGPVFQAAGVSGQTALGLIRQAIQGGWTKDTDKIADAFKEFSIRGTEGSDAVKDAFTALGLSATKTGDDIAAGGARGEKAMDQVLDRLRKLGPDSQEARQIVSTLFGGPGEDLGASLFALDVDKASAAMDSAAGAGKRLGDGLRDNAAANVTKFKNTLQQDLVEFLGTEVIPRLGGFFSFAKEHSGLLLGMAAGVTALGIAFSAAAVGVWAMNSAMLANPMFWLVAGITAAVVGLVLLIVTYWEQIKTVTMTAWGYVSSGVSGGVNGVLAAVGWLANVPGMIGGWWDAAKNYAITKSLELVQWLTSLPGRVGSALGGLPGTLAGKARDAWNSFRSASASKASDLVSWVSGLPGRISRAIGSLAGLLVGKGQDVVRGLWNGIKSMGSWLKSTLIGWAKSLIPGPIARALGIASPSKVMARDVGRWIPAGVVKGIESGQGAVDRTMTNLVSTPTPGQVSASVAATTANTAARTGGTGRVVLEVRSSGNNRFDDFLAESLRKYVRVNGGNVQTALGR